MSGISAKALGGLIKHARNQRGFTQQELAQLLGSSQSAIGRIESGGQNLTLDMINRIAEALESPLISPSNTGPLNLRITGPTQLSGVISVRSSKNASVALLCAALLNYGTTTLKNIAQIEEVNRIIEVLESIGVEITWLDNHSSLQIRRPEKLQLANIDEKAARLTRSIIMFLGPLVNDEKRFILPYAGGCSLGLRTVTPHLRALKPFGMNIKATEGYYRVEQDSVDSGLIKIVLTERGDTVTENAIMAAARRADTTIIKNASSNYMVQDLCFFLQSLGVKISGIGTTTLTVTGLTKINKDITFAPSEDPIEAMSLLTAAIVTESELTVARCPIEFLEVELAILEAMGLRFAVSDVYLADNGSTKLVDIKVYKSVLTAATDKIHPMPFPGLNIDNLPFFAVIAACAEGRTLIHDWVYESRAIHLIDLQKLGAKIELLDPHRVAVTGPTRWRAQEIICPPALRPAVCLLLSALAAKGTTVLRDTYMIYRGYEDMPNRLNALGANIEVFKDNHSA